MNNQMLVDTTSKSESPNNIEKAQTLKKKRNRSKKSKTLTETAVQSTVNTNNEVKNNIKNSQNSSSPTITTSAENINSTTPNNKPKRKRKRKKPNTTTAQNETKVENLLSKTFQDNQNNSDSQQQPQHVESLNGITTIAAKISSVDNQNIKNSNAMSKLKNQTSSSASVKIVNKVNQKKKNIGDELKKTVTTTSKKVTNDKTKAATKTTSNEKSQDEILTERKAKQLTKQTSKNKDKPSENQIKDDKNLSKEVKEQQLPSIKQSTVKSEIVNNKTSPTAQVSKPKEIQNQVSSQSEMTEDKMATTAQSIEKSSFNDLSLKRVEKSREQILAEREAKKLAKQAAKNKNKDSSAQEKNNAAVVTPASSASVAPKDVSVIVDTKPTEPPTLVPNQSETKKMSATTKAERRAIQEAQREAKAKLLAEKQQKQQQQQEKSGVKQQKDETVITITKNKDKLSPVFTQKSSSLDHKVKLFNHLYGVLKEQNLFINNPNIHPAIVRLGEQYAKRTVIGANARCIAFLNALKTVIRDFETPPKKEFSRVLETSIKNSADYLHKCRPLAVSMINAHKYIKMLLTQLPSDQPESELKERLLQCIDDYIKDQIEKASQAINSAVQEKISDGDVILTFGCSSLINHILDKALLRGVSFRVICVDSRPFMEGQEMLRRLVTNGIPCTCVLINAIGFIMPEVTKVLLGAHAILANGYVMSRTGTAQVALVAKSYNVPVLVCCETHKFSERVQTDAIVYNELGNPDDIVRMLSKIKSTASNEQNKLMTTNCLQNWRTLDKLSPLNIIYDITPPELVTAVVTEVAILPCTSVPVILRIKPTEIGY